MPKGPHGQMTPRHASQNRKKMRGSKVNPRLQWTILILLILIGVAYATYASRKEGPCMVNPQSVDCYHPPTN
jgi:hypothetical protein